MMRLTFVVSVVALSAAACAASAPDEVETAAVVPVVTAPAAVGSVRALIRATGLVAPAPGANLTITAPDAGRILEMPKAEGDSVKVGDVLLRLDVPATTANLTAAEAALAQARARVANARAANRRAHDLFDRGVAARKEIEDTDRDLADAEAALTQADSGMTAAKAMVDRTTFRATFDGVVAKRTHNPGDFVDGTSGNVILRVVDPSRLEVIAAVSVADIARVTTGAAARVVAGSGDDGPTLRVINRPVAIEPGAATGPVRLAFVGAQKYAAGTAVSITIDGEQRRGLLVPLSAIVHDGDETAVFVAAGGKAHRKVIETGVADAEHVEVTSGLEAGDAVIVQGQAGLPDEAAISVGKPAAEGEKEK